MATKQTTATDEKIADEPTETTRPLGEIASAHVGIDTFDSAGGQGFAEWQATTDLVLDTLRRCAEGSA
jgi:hypothetical protein